MDDGWGGREGENVNFVSNSIEWLINQIRDREGVGLFGRQAVKCISFSLSLSLSLQQIYNDAAPPFNVIWNIPVHRTRASSPTDFDSAPGSTMHTHERTKRPSTLLSFSNPTPASRQPSTCPHRPLRHRQPAAPCNATRPGACRTS